MDWIKQNKFLAGFIALLVVAGGGLGFLAFTAKGKFDAVYADYQTKANDLKGLQTKQPFPDEANFAKMQEVQKKHQADINALHKDLIKAQFPAKPLTPETFQEKLRQSVRKVSAQIAAKQVKLENKEFYMGFEMYQGAPPKPEAATPLGQMLEAMEFAIGKLIDSGVIEIKDVRRDPLPEEGLPSNAPPTNQKGDKEDKKDSKESSSVKRHTFTMQFVIDEPQLRDFINAMVSSKDQFYIPKSISIENEKPAGPSKTPPVGEKKSTESEIVVGDEKLNVTARFEVVNFAETPAK